MQVFQGQSESILQLTGPLDINTVDELRGTLLAYLGRSASVVVDLSSVTLCDAAGGQLLFALQKSADLAGKSFALAATSEALVRDCANLGINLSLLMATCASPDTPEDLGAGHPTQGAKKKLVEEMCNA